MNRTTWTTPLAHQQSGIQPQTLAQPLAVWPTIPTLLETLAEGFEPISLDRMEAAALLNRTDVKFIMTHEQVFTALAALRNDYWILSVSGQRLNHYRTLYFDLPNFEMYKMHVNGRSNRYKVRSREYTDTHLSFLEVKHKTRKGRTIKDRIPTNRPVTEMNLEAVAWLQNHFPFEGHILEPKLWNTFTRLTLVGKSCVERVTLDVDLNFYSNGRSVELDRLAIAELKMGVCRQGSPFWSQMRAQHVLPHGFSKYCIGVAMLYDFVKKNALKSNLRWIEKVTKGS